MAGKPVAASFRCECWLLWGCVCRWAAARPVSDVACCLWPHGCSGCRRVRPPARSPHASLRLGVVDLEAWPSSAAAHRHLGPAPRATRASRFPPCVNLRLGVVDLEAWPSPPDPTAPSTPVGLFIAVHIPSSPRRPRAPPPSPTVRPLLSRSSRVALRTGGAWCAGGDRRCFEARLCPAAAHGHRDGHQPAAVCLCWFPIWPAGGCSIRSWLAACRRRVAALMTRFPRFEAARLRFVVVRRSKCRPPR